MLLPDPVTVLAAAFLREGIGSAASAHGWAVIAVDELRHEYGTSAHVQGAHDLGTIVPVPAPTPGGDDA